MQTTCSTDRTLLQSPTPCHWSPPAQSAVEGLYTLGLILLVTVTR